MKRGRFVGIDFLWSYQWRFGWQSLSPAEVASGKFPQLIGLVWFSVGPIDFNFRDGTIKEMISC